MSAKVKQLPVVSTPKVKVKQPQVSTTKVTTPTVKVKQPWVSTSKVKAILMGASTARKPNVGATYQLWKSSTLKVK